VLVCVLALVTMVTGLGGAYSSSSVGRGCGRASVPLILASSKTSGKQDFIKV